MSRAFARGALRLAVSLAALLAPAFGTAGAAAAQITDTLPQDTARVDTTDQTARFLAAQSEDTVRVPVLSLLGAEGPRPGLTRTVFTRDSLDWAMAQTLGDLLADVPGVFLWRGGWLGRPELVNYQARGATAVEYYLDGLPYLAVGPDSVAVDASLFSLMFLERVEVERWPGLLRVRLFTRRSELLASRSRLGVATGSRGLTRYQGFLDRRFRSGAGFGVGADYINLPSDAAGASGGFRNTLIWAEGSYIPSDRFGVQFRAFRSGPRRDPFRTVAGSADSVGAGLEGSRRDAELRVSLHGRGGTGPSADLLIGRTSWDGAGFSQRVTQGGVVLGIRTPTFSATGSALLRSRWTSLDLRANAGWSPLSLVTLSGEAGYQRHDGGRTSRWVAARAGLTPIGRVLLTGSARLGEVVAAPSILSDAAQEISDFGVAAGWHSGALGLEAGFAHTAAFRPQAYQSFLTIPSIAPSPATDWVTAAVRLTPLNWLTLDGWYASPTGTAPQGLPPQHLVGNGTIRTRFWRTFPSGALELKLQASVERWGDGVIGLGAGGAPIAIEATTFIRTLVELNLVGFTIYLDNFNVANAPKSYVPGFPLPFNVNSLGLRWNFTN